MAAVIPPTASPIATNNLKLTILYDNTAVDPQLAADWGFAALVEYGNHTLLFDTGAGNDTILQDNMEQLGVNPQSVEAVVLSHEHDDHVGGLQSLLDMGVRPTVYIPATFSKYFKEKFGAQTELVEVSDALEIIPGIYATGSPDGMREQALMVETPEGTVMLVGCAHPGLVEMIHKAQDIVPGKIALLAGGFHLYVIADESRLQTLIDDLPDLGVTRVMPAHCTGYDASNMLSAAYGENYSDAGVGRVVSFAGE